MKTLEQDKVDQLLQIIQNKPGQRIVHFADEIDPLIQNLSDLCQKYQSNYYLYCTNNDLYDTAIQKYTEQPHRHIVKFNLRRPRYLMQAIEYDYLITTLDFTAEDKQVFLEKCYPIIRTGGNIIIIIPNAGYSERDEWRAILEEQYYVSTNIIHDFFEHYDVIVSKRMHGWGNT